MRFDWLFKLFCLIFLKSLNKYVYLDVSERIISFKNVDNVMILKMYNFNICIKESIVIKKLIFFLVFVLNLCLFCIIM